MYGITTLLTLGASVRGARQAAGCTQAELAERAGLSRATIIKLEAGDHCEITSVMAAMKALDLEMFLQRRQKPELDLFAETEEI